MHYNFTRIHKTLRVAPAMEAGIADHVWSLAEIVALAGQLRRNRMSDAWSVTSKHPGLSIGPLPPAKSK